MAETHRALPVVDPHRSVGREAAVAPGEEIVDDLDTCMKRIKHRDRSFEKTMSEDYMSELIDAYHHYYHYYNRSPLLVVDTRPMNFVEKDEDFEELVRQLSKPVKGTQYYVPLGSG